MLLEYIKTSQIYFLTKISLYKANYKFFIIHNILTFLKTSIKNNVIIVTKKKKRNNILNYINIIIIIAIKLV